ncbi:unnamed protein product, partial [Didymodactylos carnosus]
VSRTFVKTISASGISLVPIRATITGILAAGSTEADANYARLYLNVNCTINYSTTCQNSVTCKQTVRTELMDTTSTEQLLVPKPLVVGNSIVAIVDVTYPSILVLPATDR